MSAGGLALGAQVLIAGTVVGRSEFQDGEATYLVQYERRGRPHQEWFFSEELDEEELIDGAGV